MADYPNFNFEILHRDANNRARVGRLVTPHGVIETPNFIFCGTHAEVKTVTADQVRENGAQIILSNTYHLLVKGMADEIQAAGGLQKYTGWNGPMLTDSGGYQIFAMGHGSVSEDVGEIKRNRGTTRIVDGEISRSGQRNKKTLEGIGEDGARFTSYVDGSEIFLTPEMSVDVQRRLGADFIVQLDELTSIEHDYDYTSQSEQLSERWGDRSLAEFERGADGSQAMYGVIQGGIYEDLRKRSMDYVQSAGFFGIAVGGCLGRTPQDMYEVVEFTMKNVTVDMPVHLLGIGKSFMDIFRNVRQGIDTFDCVHPTRVARHGTALVKGAPGGRLDITKSPFTNDNTLLDASCSCHACSNGMTRAYLQEIYKRHKQTPQVEKDQLPLEENCARLLTMHNIATMTRLMRDIREGIATGTLDIIEQEWLNTASSVTMASNSSSI